ncbi:MAG: AbiEi antitoxin N-terminal domain-containing protein [Gammaproteobacteria bacterium]|nr:AbiEi antitoxin N-terminal domain-containing protein [Gammaproteobacteria bacterium]
MKKPKISRPLNSKLNNLLSYQPQGIVLTSKWLKENNYSKQIISHYCARQWLRKVGNGAYVRLNENIKWPGAIYALDSPRYNARTIGKMHIYQS